MFSKNLNDQADFKKPATHYAKSGSINIAYQVFGSGSVDLVYIPGWISNIDLMWQCPELVQFLTDLGKVARVILFDKRGTGLSDRVVELSTLEERMEDISVVMDAVRSQKAVLFGHSEGGSAAALFSATYPERVSSLIMFGAFAKRRYSEDYPWAPTEEKRQEVYDMIAGQWGSGEMNLEMLAPSKANDQVFMEWLADYFRSGASPGAALLLTKMNTQVDIRDILKSIRVPTLVMQRKNDIDVQIEEGRFLAERIEESKLVEFEGEDHLFWIGNTEEVLSEVRNFILQVKPIESYNRQLLTILLMKFDQDTTEQNIADVSEIVNKHNGTLLYSHPGLTVTFKGPSTAVYCGLDLLNVINSLNLVSGVGIHLMEVDSDSISTFNVENEQCIQALLDCVAPSQIMITQSVKYLLSGTGLNFTEWHSKFQCQGGDLISLFVVSDPSLSLNESSLPRNNAFLEALMECIYTHMNDELSVYTLCKAVGISERQLQRKLKVITHKSPVQFISSVRLHKAKELLLSRTLGIGEVAFKIGFSSPSYFSKKFKEEFGYSPSDLTNQASTA